MEHPAVVIQKVIFQALLRRGFHYTNETDATTAFQAASSGAFPEIKLNFTSLVTNISTNVVIRSIVIGKKLHVYGRCVYPENSTSDNTITHKLEIPIASTTQSLMMEEKGAVSEHPLFAQITVHLAYRLVPSCMPVADLHSLTMTRGVWIAAMQYISLVDMGALSNTCNTFNSSLNGTNEGLWKLLLKRDDKELFYKTLKFEVTTDSSSTSKSSLKASSASTSSSSHTISSAHLWYHVYKQIRTREKKQVELQREQEKYEQEIVLQREQERQRQNRSRQREQERQFLSGFGRVGGNRNPFPGDPSFGPGSNGRGGSPFGGRGGFGSGGSGGTNVGGFRFL